MKNNISFLKVKQKFNNQYVGDIPGEIEKEFHRIGLDKKIRPGMKIALTAGSRGIDRITEILQSIIKEIKKMKADPFIVTAMGSHGGATAEGQRQILSHYGITEKSMGVPIKATMDTIQLDYLQNGLPVYFDRIAYHADGVIAVNRVKLHTAFKGKIESGLYKILAVGLGNHRGARLVHSLGVKGLHDYMVEFAKVILKKAPIIAGFGILENGYDQTFRIKAARPDGFTKVDSELLEECKKILPRLPVRNIDLLIVQEIGKNISGTGMDSNIIGGIHEYKKEEFNPPQIKRILVLDLTPETLGNAMGVGMAHIITRKLYRKIDFRATYMNAITSTILERSRIPLIADTEKEALNIALQTIWNLPGTKPRIIIIRNTLKLDEIYVSEDIWEDIKDKENILPKGEWEYLDFNPKGNINLRI